MGFGGAETDNPPLSADRLNGVKRGKNDGLTYRREFTQDR